MTLTIREMNAADLPAVAHISSELGYPTTAEHLASSYAQMEKLQLNGFFVATHGDAATVIGWVHVYGVVPFQSRPFCEIGGLVVTAEKRRLGAGRVLMAAVEIWAQAKGYGQIRLASGEHRTEAHAFYEAIGYAQHWRGIKFRKLV